MKRWLTVGGIWLIVAQVAAVQPEQTKQKQQELKSLRIEIDKLKAEINKTEANKSQAIDVLQQSESAISEATSKLNDLQKKQLLSQAQLDKVNADMIKVKRHITNSQKKIAEILKTRYQQGQYEAWRLLLNQKSPDTISRDLQYYTYVVKAQQALANELKSQLLKLDRVAQEIRQQQMGLKKIYTQKQQQRMALEAEKKRKAAALSSLAQEVTDKITRLQRMQEDEKNLTYLVNRLNRILQEEARKRAREDARKKAERARLAKAQRANTQAAESSLTDPALAEQGEKTALVASVKQNQQTPDESVSGRAFIALKGRLRLPVSGAIVGRFGASREEGSTWKGILIRAPIGQPVKAIADGKVVFAEWLRGFGNMVIIDHGGGYMSLYGQNQSLVKRVGDQVKAGEDIATVGDSGGNKEAGVYFEIRQHGRPQNPLNWAPAA